MSDSKSDSIELFRAALVSGENSGLSEKSPRQIIEETKERLKKDGKP
ncbi:hypothetical protein [Thalassolituus oleivorans]|nr:hypothetical protein [Thalassolituus oleivorans]